MEKFLTIIGGVILFIIISFISGVSLLHPIMIIMFLIGTFFVIYEGKGAVNKDLDEVDT